MPEPLPVEELQSLENNLPHLRSSPALMHLAGLKLLPQQHDVPSFENPDFLTGLRRTVFGHTKKEQQLLKRQQEALVPFQQEQQILAKLNAQQQFMQSIAPPSYAEAGRRIPGMERLAPMQETTQQASQLLPFNEKGYQDAALLPGTFDINDLGHSGLSGFTPSPDGTMPRTPVRYPAQIPDQAIPLQQQNPQARLLPADVALYNQMAGQPSAIDPETGALTPMQLAKPRTDLISPGEIIREAALNESLGNVPHGTTDALRKAPPTGPFPKQAAQSALSEAAKRQLELTKVRGTHTLDDTAIAVTGVPMSEISNDATVTPDLYQQVKSLVPGSSVKVGDNLKKTIGALKAVSIPVQVAGSKAAAQTAATQATSLVPPDKQSNYIHADTYANSGKIVYPNSTQDDPFTMAKAATGGWKEITDKQKESIKAIEIARNTQSTLLDLAHQLIKAQGPGAAFAQGMKARFGAFIRSNPVAAAFMGDKEAFSGWMARMVEVGVLTQQDIQRWASVLPDERDTIGSAVEKEAILNMLFDAAELANRRSILGDTKGLETAKKSLQEQIDQAAKLYGKGKKQSAQDLFKDTFGSD